MIWWATVAGALIGLSSSFYGAMGLILGGFVGAMMGSWLQGVLRGEIARELDRRMAGFVPETAAQPREAFREEPEPEPAFAPEPEPEPIPALEPVLAAAAPAPAVTRDYTARPDPVELLTGRARDWLLGGNTIVRAGLVVLFIGLMFLARLVVNAGLFPIEARLATVGAAGAALLGVGYWKRIERPDFGLHLQGAGVAVMYLTVFAAARVFEVMPPGVAFGFMIVFAALGATLAVLQNSLTMAMASFLGGFAVPFLLGGKADTPTGLFTYITVLNLAIMGIAGRKSWRPLNLLGFFATFVMAGLWGLGAYEESHFLICEVFLALSIAIYLATALLYAHNTPGKLGNFADSTLLFGTAIAGFGLQAGLVHDKPYASAWSAVAFGAVYLAVATWTFRRRDRGMALLSECLLAIGVGFVTMAIPLALDVRWTSAAWALEGAGAFWVGMRQARWMPRAFGLALQGLGLLMVLSTGEPNISAVPLFNNAFIGPLLVALPMLLTAWWLRRELEHSGSDWAQAWEKVEQGMQHPFFLLGYLLVVVACFNEIGRQIPAPTAEGWAEGVLEPWQQVLASVLAMLGLMALFDRFGRRRNWNVATWPARLSLVVIVLGFLGTFISGRHLLTWPDVLVWGAGIALHLWLLRGQDRAAGDHPSRWNAAVHTAGALLITGWVADSLFMGVDQAELWNTSWAGVVYLVAGTGVLMVLTRWAGRAAPLQDTAGLHWPLHPHARAYWWRAAAPLAILLYVGALIGTLLAEGITDPLPYLPLINPVDLAIALVLVGLALWRRMLQSAAKMPAQAELFTGNLAVGLGTALAFVWINTVWTRTAHHYLGVGWGPGEVLGSQVVLTGFSILWTLMAMALMLFARSRTLRLPWLTGAALLGVVVAKLLFVDMSAVEGFARIVAFIGVGVLMLLIGYFVPLPPRRVEEDMA
ncbi:MAG: DUF2339 domain-containing protein [Sphingomonadaceae bacterium]